VRQTLQWQKYAGSGSALVGTVKDRCEVLQWHEAVSVVVSVIASRMLLLEIKTITWIVRRESWRTEYLSEERAKRGD
jgi:hypothetical protein